MGNQSQPSSPYCLIDKRAIIGLFKHLGINDEKHFYYWVGHYSPSRM